MYEKMGAHVVGMTGYPEVALAREAGIKYASVAVVSNFAAGVTTDPVAEEEIWRILESTKEPIFRLLKRAVQLTSTDEC